MKEAVVRSLEKVFVEGFPADDVVKLVLVQNPKWGSRDRRFIARSIYDMVRYIRYYAYIADVESMPQRTEDFQACAAVYWELTNEVMETDGPSEKIRIRQPLADAIPAVKESIPDWLFEKGVAQWGDRWYEEIHALNQEAAIYLRVNTLKCTVDQLAQQLRKDNIPFEVVQPTCIKCLQKVPVHQWKTYQDGWFEIQDIGSQHIVAGIPFRSNSLIIDACAGAGGKTLQLASITKNEANIIALDVVPKKLEELKRRAERAQARKIQTELITDRTVSKYSKTADVVLIDAPCSGSGVWRRKPDDKWKLTLNRLSELQALQKKVLHEYSDMVKPGGMVIYATCSLLQEENEAQVEDFLQQHSSFTTVDSSYVLPSSGGDGFYRAVLKREL